MNLHREENKDLHPAQSPTASQKPYEPPAITQSGTLKIQAGSICLWTKC
ncbi:MAG: hypothetical protein KatS3mg043_1800 [Rhodothermaceae bacterium]|nr:MAG: hypothetical protein KatS3mg043_1800 [Rhodothermaceae bacterium]